MRLTKLVEAYEDEADPESVDFFRNPDQDPLSDHPVVKPHGHELATGAFNFTKDRLTAKGGNVNQMMQIFQRITQIEGRHRAALQDMAKRITAKVWGISTDNMDAELGNPEPNDTADHDFGGEGSVMDDRIKSHVHMRATMNMLTHGAAVHHMMTIHHMVREELDRIDPALLDLYDKLAAGSVHQYWLVNIRQMCEMLANMAVGSARVEFPETDYEEDDEEAEPKLVARAICFPVLCQELSKAVMMLLSNHHLSKLSHGDSVTVLKKMPMLFILSRGTLWLALRSGVALRRPSPRSRALRWRRP